MIRVRKYTQTSTKWQKAQEEQHRIDPSVSILLTVTLENCCKCHMAFYRLALFAENS